MKVKVEREVNLDWLIKQLDQKSRIDPKGMGGYEVRVEKQLLRDAHDVIVQFRNEKPTINFGPDNLTLCYKE
jgi:hypothetical protein